MIFMYLLLFFYFLGFNITRWLFFEVAHCCTSGIFALNWNEIKLDSIIAFK